jgi:hypothetical protein
MSCSLQPSETAPRRLVECWAEASRRRSLRAGERQFTAHCFFSVRWPVSVLSADRDGGTALGGCGHATAAGIRTRPNTSSGGGVPPFSGVSTAGQPLRTAQNRWESDLDCGTTVAHSLLGSNRQPRRRTRATRCTGCSWSRRSTRRNLTSRAPHDVRGQEAHRHQGPRPFRAVLRS